jgi:hypothetical protein
MMMWLGSSAILLSVTATLVYLVFTGNRAEAAGIIGAVIAVIGSGVGLSRWWWARVRLDTSIRDQQHREQVDALAQAVYMQWSQEASTRGIVAPGPVRTHWRLYARDTAGEPSVTVFAPASGIAPAEIPGMPRMQSGDLPEDGTIDQLHELYTGLPSGRLVVIGEAGTGKTSAVALLLLAALHYRRSQPERKRGSIPVPVIITLSGWNPSQEDLVQFVAASLARDYSFLRKASKGSDIATRLVEQGCVALFLDGFDEMPGRARAAAVRAIDRHMISRIVLTTRPAEYEEATCRHRFHRAVAVELLPVDPATAREYLLEDRSKSARAAWEHVTDYLLENSDSPLARALGTPLMLTLASDAYPPGKNPTELMDTSSFPTTSAIEDHLLDRLLPSAYSPDRHAARYSLEKAQHWLSYLAYRMRQNETRDVLWFQISEWVPLWFSRIVFGVFFGSTVFVAAWLGVTASSLAEGHLLISGAWGLGGLGAYVTGASLDYRVSGRPVVGLIFGIGAGVWIGLLGGLAFGLWLASRWGAILGLSLGLAVGFPVAVSIGLLLVALGMRDVKMAARRSWPATFGIGSATQMSAILLAVAAVTFLLFFLLVSPRSQLIAVLIAALGICLGLVGNFLMAAQSADLAAPTPHASLRQDLIAWTMFGLVLGIVVALIFGFAFQTKFAASFVWVGLGLVTAIAASHTSGYALAVVVMLLSGRGPVRLLSFLEDARDRQILRRVGWVYQFRHARLQDRMAEHYKKLHCPR